MIGKVLTDSMIRAFSGTKNNFDNDDWLRE